MSKGNKIVIGLLIFIIIGIGTVLTLNELEVIELCNCKCPNCPKCEEKTNVNTNTESKSLIIEEDNTAMTNTKYVIKWKSDGSVVVNLGDEEKTIASNVTKYYTFYVGIPDLCTGNEMLIFESDNKIISALDMDSLVCGEEISILDDFNGIEKYDHLLQKSSYFNENHNMYYIFAVRNGIEEDISSYFDNK